MVFAKNESIASFLSKVWRERNQVSKSYLAIVDDWPPYHEQQIRQGSIDVPLSPCEEERLKWKVDIKEGKPCRTEWKLLRELTCDKEESERSDDTIQHRAQKNNPVLLELKPITGRTHQLRLHCSYVGSGIQGDSLYGTNRVLFDPEKGNDKLKLHAWKLSFPNPAVASDSSKGKDEICQFSCHPSWMMEE